jgi:hypothetical protein
MFQIGLASIGYPEGVEVPMGQNLLQLIMINAFPVGVHFSTINYVNILMLN